MSPPISLTFSELTWWLDNKTSQNTKILQVFHVLPRQDRNGHVARVAPGPEDLVQKSIEINRQDVLSVKFGFQTLSSDQERPNWISGATSAAVNIFYLNEFLNIFNLCGKAYNCWDIFCAWCMHILGTDTCCDSGGPRGMESNISQNLLPLII